MTAGWRWAANWRLVDGWLAAVGCGWRLVGVPVLSVQFNRSILSVQAVVPGARWRWAVGWLTAGWRWLSAGGGCQLAAVVSWRALAVSGLSWATRRGQFCGCTPLNGKNDSQYSKLQVIEHKSPDFVLETPENRGSEGQKRTKTSILCSKRPKMGVSEAKKAQKPRFCARGDWDWHREER